MRRVWMILTIVVVGAALAGEPGPQLKLLGTLEGGRPGVYQTIAFSPDGKLLASTDSDRDAARPSVKLWDVKKRKVIATLKGPGLSSFTSSLAFSPDGKTLAVGGYGDRGKS